METVRRTVIAKGLGGGINKQNTEEFQSGGVGECSLW